MKNRPNLTRLLGYAFLFQFVTSFSSGQFLRPTWLVAGDMQATLLKIAASPALLQANMLVDVLTALGVIFLGAALYTTLKHQNKILALTAFGFYVLEGALLGASKLAGFSLLGLSQEYAQSGGESLLVLGNLALEGMDYIGDTLHVVVFCLGALVFYSLLDRARLVPRWLSLWGLVTLLPLTAGTFTAVFGLDLPFFLFIPYVPFEPFIGAWIAIKGLPERA